MEKALVAHSLRAHVRLIQMSHLLTKNVCASQTRPSHPQRTDLILGFMGCNQWHVQQSTNRRCSKNPSLLAQVELRLSHHKTIINSFFSFAVYLGCNIVSSCDSFVSKHIHACIQRTSFTQLLLLVGNFNKQSNKVEQRFSAFILFPTNRPIKLLEYRITR